MMKFKKLFWVVAILPILGMMFSCHNTKEAEIAQLPYVNFENNVEELNFIKAGETKILNLESSRSWKIMNIPDWLSVSPEEGNGNKQITIIASPNTGAKRQATIAVNLKQSTGFFVSLKLLQDGEDGGEPGGADALYFEDFGTKVAKVDNKWPWVDQYIGWSRKGTLSQADVVYSGKGASVRPTGKNNEPTGDVPSGSPWGYMANSSDHFQIAKINVTGNTNLTLQFYAQHQSGYANKQPIFSPITSATLKVYAGFDGEAWAEIPISSDGVVGWSLIKSEFKIPEDKSAIYLKFADFVGADNNQLRLDDIAIVAGGSGVLINPVGGDTPPPTGDEVKKSISDIRAHKQGGAAAPENGWYVEGIVVSDKDGKNIQPFQIAVVDNTTENSGLMFTYKQDETAPNFAVGDKVKIVLSGTKYKDYNGLLQVIDIKADNVSRISTANAAEPVVITAEQLITGKYESMLVAVDNTELVDKNPVLKMYGEKGSLKVKSEGTEFTMYTNKNAEFKDKPAPMGKGRLVGIAGVYKKAKQILPRNEGDFAGMVEGGDTPPPPSGEDTKKSISEIRAHKQGGATAPESGWYVEGIVVSDKEGKNNNAAQIVVVDNSTVNSGLVFRYATGQTNPSFSVGDKVKIVLSDTKYGEFKKLQQVSDLKSDNVTFISSANAAEPVVITAEQLITGKYESMLVAVDNTELVDKSDPALKMVGGVKVTSEGTEFVMFTGKHAVFKDETAPMGKGKLIGLAAVYETKIQVLPRNEADFAEMVATGGTTPTPTLNVNATEISVATAGGEQTINLTTTPDGLAWTATLADGATVTPTISPATGNGSAPIKVTFPENTDTENSKTATVKLSAEGADDVNVVFTQAKVETAEITYLTVKQVRDKYTGTEVTITENVVLKATVVSSLAGGNMASKKNMVVQDKTAGIAVRLTADNVDFQFGDKLEINLKDQKLSLHNGLLQINNLPLANAEKKGSETITAKSITAEQLLTGKYESQYVAIADVQVITADLGKKMVDGDNHTSIGIESEQGQEFVMFSSKHVSFKNDKVPQGSGVLKGLASINKAKIQLLPTVAADYSAMTKERFGASITPTLSVNATAVSVTAAGGEHTINLTATPADLAWTATLADGATVTPTITPASGSGNAGIKVTFPENSEATKKTATVKLSAVGASDVNVVFTQAKKEAEPTPSPDAANFPAIWNFETAGFEGGLVKATGGNTNATIGVWGTEGISFSKDKKAIVAKGWEKDKTAWEIKVPVNNLAANTKIVLDFEQASSGTGPKDFVAEYSTDNGSSWTASGSLKPMDGTKTEQKVEMAISTAISSGDLIIRLKVSTNKAAKGDKNFAKGGTSRLAGGKFSITLK